MLNLEMFITISGAKEYLQKQGKTVSERALRYAARRGNVASLKIGRDWLLLKDSLDQYARLPKRGKFTQKSISK